MSEQDTQQPDLTEDRILRTEAGEGVAPDGPYSGLLNAIVLREHLAEERGTFEGSDSAREALIAELAQQAQIVGKLKVFYGLEEPPRRHP